MALIEEVLKRPGFWSSYGPYNDVALSSRIRLARNFHSVTFPSRLDDGDFYIIKMAMDHFASESQFAGGVRLIDLSKLDSHEKRILRERNIITCEMENSLRSLVAVDGNNDFAVLVNEEDHFRIQVIKPGLQLMEAYRLADRVDDELNKYVIYAYSDDYGYLSVCPSNLGTGLRCSVQLHLPALTIKNKINDLMPFLKERGVELRGTTGEKNKTLGSIYQISNRISLGMSEVDIIEVMDNAVNTIIAQEDRERDEYVSTSRTLLEDRVFRSLGILTHARRISYVEAMDYISNVRLGIILAVIKKLDIAIINDLMVNIQWSHLQNKMGKPIVTSNQCDEFRSEYIRRVLNSEDNNV